MSEPIEIRCSALPLAFTCPGSVRPSGIVIDESGAEAELGTAAHEGLAPVAETGRVEWHEVPALAVRHGVDEGELRALLALGARLWASGDLAGLFPDASTERELVYRDPAGAFVLTGHADVVAWVADVVRVGDWKTGRKDADYADQLRGYCVLALEVAGFGATRAEAFVLWVRDEEVERYAMSRAEARAFLDRVRDEIVNWNGRYTVGSHCAHCPRNHECPAGLALVRRDVAAVADDALAERLESGDALAALAPAEVVSLLARADLAASVAYRVRKAIRAYVEEHGDVVGGGRRLTLQHDERRSLDTLAAWPVLLERGFDDDDLAAVTDVSMAAAEGVVKRKAPPRKGAAAARELAAALAEAGAIKTTTTTKLVVKRQ